MSGNFTQTPNLGLFKPSIAADYGQWGSHLNANADKLDAAMGPGGGVFLPLSGGTMTGPLNLVATGATAVRSVQDRAADVANILDYGAGTGGDDAAAFRGALASGKRVIYCPPGTYTFKSQQVPPGPMNWQPVPAVLFNGVSNLTVIAHGATFLIDDAMTYPVAAWSNAGNAHCGFTGNCQNVVWKGGRFYGNTTHAAGAINTGMWFQNCTGILIEDTEWLGDYHAAPIFGGVWMFDCTFRNNRSYGSGNGFDHAYCENLTLISNRFDGSQIAGSVASTGFKLFTDPATKGFNTAGQTLAQSTWLPSGNVRQLRGGVSNNIRLIGNIFAGWITGVYLDGIDGAILSNNTIRDGITGSNGSGVTVTTSADTTTAGYITRDISVIDGEIYANANPGVLIAPGTNGIGPIEIVRNRIYDNICTNAITFLSTTSVGTFRLVDNDFLTRTVSSVQANPYDAPTLDAVGAIYRRNLGATPYDQAGAFSTLSTTGAITAGGAVNATGAITTSAGVTAAISTIGSPTAGSADLVFEAATGVARRLRFLTGSSERWDFLIGGTEGGGNAGSDIYLTSFSDTGSAIANAMVLTRATSAITLAGTLTVTNGRIIAQAGGGAGSFTCSDGTHTAGMFTNGTGIAFGPTNSAGNPAAIWTSLDANGWKMGGSMSAWNATPPASKPIVSGAKGSNTALASLLTALASYGLITDSTSA